MEETFFKILKTQINTVNIREIGHNTQENRKIDKINKFDIHSAS